MDPDNDALLGAALAVRAGGVSIIPTSERDKQPVWQLLPPGEDGGPSWKPYASAAASEEVVRGWFRRGLRSFAGVGGGVSGGLLVIDFDVPRFYDAWRVAVGPLADGLPVQQTGRDGGGVQVWLRCPEPGGSEKLAWSPDPSADTGRTIAVETRGEGGYAVLAPSLHPSGRRYAALSGDFTKIPTVPQAVADALLAAARKLDECPFTKQELEQRAEAEARKLHLRRAASYNGSASVIEAFNQAHPLAGVLEAHGYRRGRRGRYVPPRRRQRVRVGP